MYTKPHKFFSLFISVVLLFNVTSCSSPIDRAIQMVDDAIARILQDSSRWRSTVENLADQFPKDIKEIIREDVTNLAGDVAGMAGVEAKCYTDFVSRKVIQTLERIKAKLLRERDENVEIPAQQPIICSISPTTFDPNDPESDTNITMYGYDFKAEDSFGNQLRLYFVAETSGNKIEVEDSHITQSSNYAYVISVSDMRNLLLRNKISSIRAYWNDTPLKDGEVGVVLKKFSEEIITDYVAGTTGPFNPPQTGEDGNFGGNEINYNVQASIVSDGKNLYYKIYMHAKEVKGGTEVDGVKKYDPFYSAPAGQRIMFFSPNQATSTEGTAKGSKITKDFGSGTVAQRFEIFLDQGDDHWWSGEDDVEIYTGVTVWFRNIEIVLTEDEEIHSYPECKTPEQESVMKSFILPSGYDVSYCRNQCFIDFECKAWQFIGGSCQLLSAIPTKNPVFVSLQMLGLRCGNK